MLPGKDKASMHENVRELKHKGLSEKDAVMASMKHANVKRNKSSDVLATSPEDDFPYGLRVELDHESMGKLGMHKGRMPHVGKMVHIKAKAKVHRTSENSDEHGKQQRNMTLQITHMKLGHDDSNDADEHDEGR
jgi:hypothetical protein